MKKVGEHDQEIPPSRMIRKYYHHTLQINLQHCEEKPQEAKSHKTSMKRYTHYTYPTRSGNTIKQ